VQDVFLRLWKSEAKFDSLSSLKAFLYNSVKNASLNALRYHAKFSGSGMHGDQTANLPEMKESAIERMIIEEEYVRQIHLAINKLSDERRKIILLSMEGHGNKKIAQSLGISVNTLKTLKRKAYRFLREELKQLKAFLF
jgi:RNA polymerase sigma-70 factor (ECF subfamily)